MAEEQVARTSVTAADAEEYTQSLAQHLTADWRQIELAKRMGIPEALGLSVKEWVETRLGGYLKQGVTARLEAVKELEAQGYTQRETAEILGIGQKTVSRVLESDDSKPAVKAKVQAVKPAPVESNDSNAKDVETQICQGVTAKGDPCRKKSVDGSKHCKDHNPLKLAEKEIDSLELQLQQAEEQMEQDKADFEARIQELTSKLEAATPKPEIAKQAKKMEELIKEKGLTVPVPEIPQPVEEGSLVDRAYQSILDLESRLAALGKIKGSAALLLQEIKDFDASVPDREVIRGNERELMQDISTHISDSQWAITDLMGIERIENK